MVRRTVALLALLLPLVAAAESSAGQAPPLPTVELSQVCPDTGFVVTIDNQTAISYEVVVSIGPDAVGLPPVQTEEVTVGPESTVVVTLDVTGGPFVISVTGDGDFPPTSFGTVYGCPIRRDLAVTTPEATPIDIDLGAPCFAGDTEHATVDQVDNFTVRYTPEPGFVGVDTFDYSCTGSGNQLGTVTVTVTPAQAPPPEPVPEAPTFTG